MGKRIEESEKIKKKGGVKKNNFRDDMNVKGACA